jgi:hypothetical protein
MLPVIVQIVIVLSFVILSAMYCLLSALTRVGAINIVIAYTFD